MIGYMELLNMLAAVASGVIIVVVGAFSIAAILFDDLV